MKKGWYALLILAFFGALVMGVKAADYNLGGDLVWGPPGESAGSALSKLEIRDEDLLNYINDLKDSYASSTAPTSPTPSEGQFWWDTTNDPDGQLWIYNDNAWRSMLTVTGGVATWTGGLSIGIGSIDNLSAINSSLTNADIISATVGSATVNSLTTINWNQTSLSIGTLAFTGILESNGGIIETDVITSAFDTTVTFSRYIPMSQWFNGSTSLGTTSTTYYPLPNSDSFTVYVATFGDGLGIDIDVLYWASTVSATAESILIELYGGDYRNSFAAPSFSVVDSTRGQTGISNRGYALTVSDAANDVYYIEVTNEDTGQDAHITGIRRNYNVGSISAIP